MLFENSSAEMALLLFTLLAPIGVMALAAMALVRGFAPAGSSEAGRKADRLTTLPAVVMLVGLVSSFFHLGHMGSVFYMMSGIGSSPLSNEIAVAAVAIVVGAVYWIISLVKGLPSTANKAFGVVLLVLGAACAIFTGTAYSIATIPTWDTPFNWIGQLSLALLGGSILAAASFALAGYPVEKTGSVALKACGAVGLVGVAVTLMGLAAIAGGAISSAGATLGAIMGDYATVAAACIVLCAVGYGLWACSKSRMVMVVGGMVCVLVGLALMRVDFYGVFLSAGLAYL